MEAGKLEIEEEAWTIVHEKRTEKEGSKRGMKILSECGEGRDKR